MFECAVMFPSWLSEFWICYNAVEFPFSVFIFAVVFLNFLSCLWFRGHIFQICRHDSWIYGQVSESPVVFPCSQKYLLQLPYLKGRGASGANSRNPGNNVRQLTVDGKSYTYQGTLRAHNAFCCSCGLLGFFFFLCCHASQCALVFLNSTISNMRSCFGFTVVTFEFCCGVFKLITLPNLRSCLRIRCLVVFFGFVIFCEFPVAFPN